ncbi:MAG: FAD-binding protein [Proteobacteria bacterium]|nr:FAD-binding protein [Pseudomonadota bacterium]
MKLREDRVLKRIEGIVSRENLFTDPEHRVSYSYDALNRETLPAAVAFPRSALEVSEILRVASEEGFPVIPRGAGSGRAGGSIPVPEGLVLSLERLTTIHNIDGDNLLAETDPGVVTGVLHQRVQAEKLFYPPDPASQSFCTIGGNVSTNAGGLRTVKYGVTRDYILALEAVLPDGQILHAGRKTRKSVVGYDLVRLLVGSEGTLAVVTRITVKLIPLPEGRKTLLAYFPDVSRAGNAVRTVLRKGFLEILGEAGAFEVLIAEDQKAADNLWQARRALSPTLAKLYPQRISEDVAVPLDRIADLLRATEEICRGRGVGNANFGHAGDGNIHLNLLFDAGNHQQVESAEAAVGEILRAVVGMGGTISGEHGIGLAKRPYLALEVLEPALSLMKRIKQTFDPKGILNPGKILP